MPSDDHADETITPDDASHHELEPGGHTIDMEALAERVYQLLLAEARIGRSRSEEPPRWMEE